VILGNLARGLLELQCRVRWKPYAEFRLGRRLTRELALDGDALLVDDLATASGHEVTRVLDDRREPVLGGSSEGCGQDREQYATSAQHDGARAEGGC
jgi:hypothetical protein